jgi:hypothetical protein
MNHKLLKLILVGALSNAAALACSGAWADDAGNFSVASGFDYSSGKYGSADTTDILTIPVVGFYNSGLWMFKLTVPYVRITGVGGVLSDGRRVKSTTATANARSTTHSGLGDVIAAASYNLYSGSDDGLRVDLTGKIKFGTADTTLGTGKNDYAAQADVYQSFDGFTAMGALGYEVLGSPAGVDMNNVVYGVLGGYYQMSGQTGGGLEMKVAQKPSAIGAEQRELTAYAIHRIDENLKIRGYVLKGFADGSPDSGFGVLLTAAL